MPRRKKYRRWTGACWCIKSWNGSLARTIGREEALLALAAAEFADAELRGVTGYPLLWEMEKQAIADGLRRFFAADADWLGETLAESRAEVPFDDVDVTVDCLGTVRFRGKIDRLDVVGGEVRVRDFKTGRPDRYTARATSQNAYTVANGRALQLPVYTAAARQMYPEPDIRASYCFPLSDRPPWRPGHTTMQKTRRSFMPHCKASWARLAPVSFRPRPTGPASSARAATATSTVFAQRAGGKLGSAGAGMTLPCSPITVWAARPP